MSDDLDLGPEREVASPPRQGIRVVIALLGAAVIAAGLVIGAAWLVGTFAQTEAGLCRLTWAPCAELSVASVESLSGLALPEGTEVTSGYALESPGDTTFRAEIVLPEGAESPLPARYYEPDIPEPELIPAAMGSDLGDLTYWYADDAPEGSVASAATGTDAQGRTVILFDTHPVG